MADLLRRAVRSRQVVPTEPTTLDVEGERLVVPPQLVADAMHRAQDRGKPHNVARVTFNKSALDAMVKLLADQLRERGTTVDDADLKVLREDIRSSYDARVLLNTAWLPLPAEKLLEDLYARPNWLASLTPNWSPERRALLARDRGAGFTVEDVPLLDEAAELLGTFDPTGGAAKRQAKASRKRDIENARQAIENMGVEGIVSAEQVAGAFAEGGDPRTTAERAAEDREWTYGHIVVDEAQELSPMQWRVLARRNPLRSFTIVGDMAQGSSPGAARTWDDVIGALARRRRGRAPQVPLDHRVEELTVNYRTPRSIVQAAGEFAAAAGLTVTANQAVRDGDPVVRLRVPRAEVLDTIAATVEAERDHIGSGTTGVIVPDSQVDVVRQRLARTDADVRTLGSPRPGSVTVLTGADAKGLEFDGVLLVDPDGVGADAAAVGRRAVYVAMTRPDASPDGHRRRLEAPPARPVTARAARPGHGRQMGSPSARTRCHERGPRPVELAARHRHRGARDGDRPGEVVAAPAADAPAPYGGARRPARPSRRDRRTTPCRSARPGSGRRSHRCDGRRSAWGRTYAAGHRRWVSVGRSGQHADACATPR